MPFVSAGPNEYLLIGRRGRLENRGSAVRTFLMPGTVFVRVPSTKHEAAFEFTQETKDGIPLRFKGIIIYRITDPIAAARLFDFSRGAGVAQITTLLTHVGLGELRHAVSHMTMVECIEQRKTTLSGVVEEALRTATERGDGEASDWGVSIEVAQVAQVYIVDPELRQQLEAEVRNEIRLRSDQSDIATKEETRLAEMASEGRVEEQRLANDREAVRREEELQLAKLARERRMKTEGLETERQAFELERERFRAQMATAQDRLATEEPVRLARITQERDLLREELEMRQIQNEVKALDVEHELLLPRAQQALRREILPIEQAPQIVASAAKVLQGTNLSIYGEDGRIVGQLAPVFELLARAVRDAVPAARETVPASREAVPASGEAVPAASSEGAAGEPR